MHVRQANRRAVWAARLIVTVHVAVLGLPTPVAAQTGDRFVPYVVRVPGSVRGQGLNGAGVALVGDAGAVFANPAGIATIGHIGLEGGYRPAPGGARFLTGAMGWRIRHLDLGVGGRYFDFGSAPARYLGPAATPGSYSREALVVGSLVYRFGMIALGASGKYARRSIDSTHVRGFTADAGLAIAFFDIMAFALSVQNIGGNWQGSSLLELPRMTRLGFTMNYVDPQESFRLLSTFEVQWLDGGGNRAVIGGEGGVVLHGVGIIGRLAYGGGTPFLPGAGFTFGGTVRIGVLNADYAYRRADLFGEPAHTIGVRLTL